MDVEKTIKNLKARHFNVEHFKTSEEAKQYLLDNIKGVDVGIGGCMTADGMGLYEALGENNSVYWHWKVPMEERPEVIEKANHAPVYISGINALAETGEIVNIDGTGNRVAAQVYGDKTVYFVVGTNKIVATFEDAIYRARHVAAVQNGKRYPTRIPCRLDNQCHDCRSDQRMCNALLVLWSPTRDTKYVVVLIDEELGY